MVLSMDEDCECDLHSYGRAIRRTSDRRHCGESWEEDTGYSAEVWVQGRSQFLVESNMIEAILRYLHSEYNIRAYREDVTLDLDEEITAIVNK